MSDAITESRRSTAKWVEALKQLIEFYSVETTSERKSEIKDWFSMYGYEPKEIEEKLRTMGFMA